MNLLVKRKDYNDKNKDIKHIAGNYNENIKVKQEMTDWGKDLLSVQSI